MKNGGNGIKMRLMFMMFLQLAVLGCYIISLGGFLALKGLAPRIGTFYAMGGIAALLMPALVGSVADRFIPAQRLLGLMHLLLAMVLTLFAFHCKSQLGQVPMVRSVLLFLLVQMLYIPTLPLSISICFSALNRGGLDRERHYPVIRMMGTLGFVVTMVLVDYMGLTGGEGQFLMAAACSFVLFLLSFALPDCPPSRTRQRGSLSMMVTLFRNRKVAVFLLLMLAMGMLLKASESYINPFLTARQLSHPNVLMSLSRISEAVLMMSLPVLLHRLGFRKTFILAAAGWCVHFAALGLGSLFGGTSLFILSMLVYGLAYNCSITTGAMYVDSQVDASLRATAQGLLTTFQNGFAVLIGSMAAQSLFNAFVYQAETPDWLTPWFLLAGFAILVGLAFALFFDRKR